MIYSIKELQLLTYTGIPPGATNAAFITDGLRGRFRCRLLHTAPKFRFPRKSGGWTAAVENKRVGALPHSSHPDHFVHR